MRQADLSPSTQVVLMGLLAVVSVAFLTRVIVFFRREIAGMLPAYPRGWTAVQCRALECFRQLIGVALIPLWVGFVFLSPSMPASWPIGFVEVLSLISMLLISHAWVLLVSPRDWKHLDAFPHSFWITIGFLTVWWAIALTAVGLIFAEASASPPLRVYSDGVYAAQEVTP